MKKIIVVTLILLALTTHVKAQFGLSGGLSVLKGFGGPKPFVGLQLTGELPRDDYASFFIRASFYAKQTDLTVNTGYLEAVSPTTNPFTQSVTFTNSMNYTVLEGGNRFYIGDGYDNGFGAYGGGTLQVIFNAVKRKYDFGSIDMSKYQLPANENLKGTIFGLGFGLNGGLKYSFAGYGTAYFESGFSYVLNAQASNSTASAVGNLFSPLFFTFAIGFRKEFY